MAEVALIHMLKLMVLMVRIQVASVDMGDNAKDVILASVADSESFLQSYIDSRSGKDKDLFQLRNTNKKEYMN